jgi:hypothetical protein
VNTVSVWYVLGRGLFCGLLGFLGMFVVNRDAGDFLSGSYWKWLVGALACALLGPITYMWMQSFQISLIDAATLHVLRAGSWHVAEGYGLFGGVVLGGVAVGLVERLRESRR